MKEIKCLSCSIPMGKSHTEPTYIFCFNCADLKERGIE